ncbi:MAG: hypothetical protein RLZZ534_1040 [Actinomycetota bacterium]
MFVDFARNYYVPSVTETTSRGERTYDLYSRLLKENIIKADKFDKIESLLATKLTEKTKELADKMK